MLRHRGDGSRCDRPGRGRVAALAGLSGRPGAPHRARPRFPTRRRRPGSGRGAHDRRRAPWRRRSRGARPGSARLAWLPALGRGPVARIQRRPAVSDDRCAFRSRVRPWSDRGADQSHDPGRGDRCGAGRRHAGVRRQHRRRCRTPRLYGADWTAAIDFLQEEDEAPSGGRPEIGRIIAPDPAVEASNVAVSEVRLDGGRLRRCPSCPGGNIAPTITAGRAPDGSTRSPWARRRCDGTGCASATA